MARAKTEHERKLELYRQLLIESLLLERWIADFERACPVNPPVSDLRSRLSKVKGWLFQMEQGLGRDAARIKGQYLPLRHEEVITVGIGGEP